MSQALEQSAGAVFSRGRRSLLGFGSPLALTMTLACVLAPDDAAAAAVRSSATALGALGVFAALIVMREWPVALTGSMWAAGTVFAAALWLMRARFRAAGFTAGAAAGPGRAERRPLVSVSSGIAVGAGDAMPGIDRAEVLSAARRCFLSLQAAWDAGDIEALRERTTDEVLEDLLQQLPLCGTGPNRTDVVTLDAALLAFEEFGSRYVASVEFSGMIRESTEGGAAPFKEVWMLTTPKERFPEFRLARHQALL